MAHPFTAEQIREMLRKAEEDADDVLHVINKQVRHYARLQRDIGAMKMELEIMDEQSKMPGGS
jgi:hypothetical protein